MFSDLKYRLYSLGFVCFIDFLKILDVCIYVQVCEGILARALS